MAKSPIVLALSTTFLQRFSQHFSTDGGRNPIGLRTESDRTADGNRSDGGRNLIGRRTRTMAHLGGALVSSAPTEQEIHQPSKNCANRARAAPTEQELHPLQAPSVVTFSHRTHRTHRIYCCVFSHKFHGNTQIVRVQKIKNNGLSG